ncbi:MAG: hypothetical protein RSA53_08255 [Odoribacter sp.]
MRKLVFVVSLLIGFVVAAEAQLKFDREIKTGLFVPKGAWLVGTTFSYSEMRSTDFKFMVLKDANGDGYTFKISPFCGYFFADNMAAGLRLAYSRSYTNLENIDLDLGDDLNFNVADQTYLEHNFMASGFLRTYMGLGASKVFGFFNEARLSYGCGQGKETSGKGNEKTGSYQTIHNLQIGVAPGLAAFVTNFSAVEVSVGVMGFDFKWIDQSRNQVDSGKFVKSSGNFKIDLFSINIGMTFYI